MYKGFYERQKELFVLRLFLLIIFSGGLLAGVDYVYRTISGEKLGDFSQSVFVCAFVPFSLFLAALFFRATVGTVSETRDTTKLVKTRRLEEAREATIGEAYSLWGTKYPDDQILYVRLTRHGMINQSGAFDDFETGLQIKHMLKHRRQYEKFYNVKLMFTEKEYNEYLKRMTK